MIAILTATPLSRSEPKKRSMSLGGKHRPQELQLTEFESCRLPAPYFQPPRQFDIRSFSQDGKWVYFGNHRTGPYEILRVIGKRPDRSGPLFFVA